MANLVIHGNGRTFAGPMDLPDTTHKSLANFYRDEYLKRVSVGEDGRQVHPDGLWVADHCVGRVRTAALYAGWTPECAERLATVAGGMYADIMARVARGVRRA